MEVFIYLNDVCACPKIVVEQLGQDHTGTVHICPDQPGVQLQRPVNWLQTPEFLQGVMLAITGLTTPEF